MNWDETFRGVSDDVQKNLYQQDQQAQANQVYSQLIGKILENQNQPIPGTEGVNLNPYAENERQTAIRGLTGLTGDTSQLPTGQVGATMVNLLNTLNKSDTTRASAWETAQRQRDNIDAKNQAKQDQIDQVYAAKQELADKISQIDGWVKAGQLTQEQGDAWKNKLAGIQTAPKGELGQALDFTKLPPDQQQAVLNYFGSKANQTHVTVPPQPPSSFKEFERANADPAYAAWLDKYKNQPGTLKPAEVSRIDKNTRDQLENAKVSYGSDPQLMQAALDEINQRRTEAGLATFVAKTTTQDLGTNWWGGSKGTKTRTDYLPDSSTVGGTVGNLFSGEAPVPAKAPQQNAAPSSSAPMQAMPPAQQYPGKVVRDTVTGRRYKSNGSQWIGVQ